MARVIPTDIIIEILLHLPVKSLLRFKCVSKSWKTLITSPKMSVGALVNNHLLHWIVHLRESYKIIIACFDLCTDEWSLISVPDERDFQVQLLRRKLSVHENGCLCLSIVHCQDLVDVWILKDYAVKESWVKIRVSRNYPLILRYRCFHYNKELFSCLHDLHVSEKWYAEICTGSLVTLPYVHKLKFSWKHRLSKAFSCLTT
ncbi:putative F-box protein At5g62060 [Beta vulgaris subsp. vulgaris]|uniref:putative F-box protein At5g62060 n=1 Tax=Beta vulgaris subsp. vulgaris TaxID=3555 RepID=UPI0025482DDD|nr:putative F-box protein At5g62060 [Beta vulgaris subsp. vulgaris]